MNLVLEFLPEAEAEAQCITGDYEAKVPGLGARFRHELEDACSAIVQHPLLWRLRDVGWRRVNFPGFPYYIAFIIRDEVAHREQSGETLPKPAVRVTRDGEMVAA